MKSNLIQVEYKSGESRVNPEIGVDYMLATVNTDGKEIELYAEMDFEENESTYDGLKESIIKQALENNIDVGLLQFYYD